MPESPRSIWFRPPPASHSRPGGKNKVTQSNKRRKTWSQTLPNCWFINSNCNSSYVQTSQLKENHPKMTKFHQHVLFLLWWLVTNSCGVGTSWEQTRWLHDGHFWSGKVGTVLLCTWKNSQKTLMYKKHKRHTKKRLISKHHPVSGFKAPSSFLVLRRGPKRIPEACSGCVCVCVCAHVFVLVCGMRTMFWSHCPLIFHGHLSHGRFYSIVSFSANVFSSPPVR